MATSHVTSSGESAAIAGYAAGRISRLRLYGMLTLGITCIGMSAIFTRWAGVPGTVSALYRVAIAVIVLAFPLGHGLARGSIRVDRRAWLLAAAAGIFFALDLSLWNVSLFMTPAATATLLDNDAPIIVGLGALLIFHERLTRHYWFGLTIALAGIVIIAGKDLSSHTTLGAGDLLALAAGVSYASYLLSTQRIRSRLDTVSSLWMPCLAGTVFLLLFNLTAHRALWGFSGQTYLSLLGLGIVSQVIGWLAITYALGHLPASVVSVTLLGQPVLTALFAIPFLGEYLSGTQIIGGVVALAGIYLVNRGFARTG